MILFKFQNCAPTNPGEQFVSETDGEVRVIDRWGAAGKLEFMSPSYMVENTGQSIQVPGLCVGAPSGLKLFWELHDSSLSGVVESGMAECKMGNFHLNISRVVFNDCRTRLELRAQAEDSDSTPAITVLKPFCDG